MKLNLQYFADEEISIGANESAVSDDTPAEQITTATEGATAEETTDNPVSQETEVVDRNAIFAEARRVAEANARKAFEQKQAELDAEVARRYGNLTNPKTGAPIRTQADYFAALEAQEQMKLEAELKDRGVDVSLIEKAIANNPAIREANEIIRKNQERDFQDALAKDIAAVHELDESINSLEDVPQDLIDFCASKKLTLADGYKIKNYGKWNAKSAESATQAAINQIKGKGHLAPINGIATTSNEVEIPNELRGVWEQMFPGKSAAELRKLYNKQL